MMRVSGGGADDDDEKKEAAAATNVKRNDDAIRFSNFYTSNETRPCARVDLAGEQSRPVIESESTCARQQTATHLHPHLNYYHHCETNLNLFLCRSKVEN